MSNAERRSRNGRKVRTVRGESQWRELLSSFEQSGLSVRAFCEQHDLTQSTFHLWRKRLRDVPSFVALVPPVVEPGYWDVELSLGAGVTLRLRQR